ncbi:MAG TPA: hypothetical protein VKI99_19380 [Candidatus Dormibacteraeota bacterium]|nr:hypothetical protein [Candidatus Dormibacteraeota bacterium]
MNLRHLPLAAAGLGAAAIAACGSATTLDVTPAAAVKAAPARQASEACDAGRWTGAVNPEGRPDGFDAGDAGAVYVWHDGDGWHIRSTDKRPTDHHYTGSIHLSKGGSFTDLHPVRDEKDDTVSVDGDNTLHYDFHTFASIDGVDFRVTCPPQRGVDVERQRLTFHTMFDGRPIADRVRIGDAKQSPKAATFAFTRAS